MTPEAYFAKIEDERLTWDQLFMNIAWEFSKRATCPKRNVGAVITLGTRQISAGYNGSAAGTPHCTEVGCNEEDGHCQRAIHAEMNAILQIVVQGGPSTRGGTLYTTDFPCNNCAK